MVIAAIDAATSEEEVCVAACPLSIPRRRDAAIEDSHRLLNCARCHVQVRICRRCDRGNIYCAAGCREAARAERRREARRRYERSAVGRRRNVVRQRRYRAAHRAGGEPVAANSVTHQGPPDAPNGGYSLAQVAMAAMVVAPSRSQEVIRGATLVLDGPRVARCDFCGAPCGRLSRRGPLRRRLRRGRRRGPRR